jgi:hypothetical protein
MLSDWARIVESPWLRTIYRQLLAQDIRSCPQDQDTVSWNRYPKTLNTVEIRDPLYAAKLDR